MHLDLCTGPSANCNILRSTRLIHYYKSLFLPTGVTGNVTIDENGDRDGEFSILDMNPNTGHFEVNNQINPIPFEAALKFRVLNSLFLLTEEFTSSVKVLRMMKCGFK